MKYSRNCPSSFIENYVEAQFTGPFINSETAWNYYDANHYIIGIKKIAFDA